MRALVQRVSEAQVRVAGDSVGQIGAGLLVLVCALRGDDKRAAEALAAKTAKLRVFRDEQGRMNRSLLDMGGSALVISQFTLAADTRRGHTTWLFRGGSPGRRTTSLRGIRRRVGQDRRAGWDRDLRCGYASVADQ